MIKNIVDLGRDAILNMDRDKNRAENYIKA